MVNKENEINAAKRSEAAFIYVKNSKFINQNPKGELHNGAYRRNV